MPVAGHPPQLVIFIGLQGSGKTTYYRANFAATHVHVSKDLMTNVRNRDTRQQEMIETALGEGKSVVVDNTNPTAAVRAPLIAMGKHQGAHVVGYFFDVPVKVAVQRNRGREGRARVPDVAVYVTARKLAAPSLAEGFDEVHVVAAPA